MAHAIRLQMGASRQQMGALRISQLDFTRIAAETGTFAINAVLLLLLLTPLTVPKVAPMHKPDDVIVWLPRVKPKPVPPIEVPVVKQQPRLTPANTIVQPQHVVPQPEFAVIDPTGEIAVPSNNEVITEINRDTIGAIREPLTGAQLQYAVAPPPAYPRDAMLDGLTGTVLLQVLVDIDGKPLAVLIARSSGHRALDHAARKQVLARWRFQPAMLNGQAVQAIGLVPIEFALAR